MQVFDRGSDYHEKNHITTYHQTKRKCTTRLQDVDDKVLGQLAGGRAGGKAHAHRTNYFIALKKIVLN